MSMAEWLAEQGQLLLTLLEEHQYLVLALAMGFEAVGVPLPISAEFVVVTMGFQVYRGEANPWAVMGTVVASATVGVSVQYWIARGYTFLSLEDETGLVNIIIRPSVLTRYQRAILDSPVMLVHGEMQDLHGPVQVMAHTCTPATSDGLGAPPSRDWS